MTYLLDPEPNDLISRKPENLTSMTYFRSSLFRLEQKKTNNKKNKMKQ